MPKKSKTNKKQPQQDKVTIPSEVHYDQISNNNINDIVNIEDTESVPKIVKKKTRIRKPKTQQDLMDPETGLLRISEKRKLAYNLLRTLHSNEMFLNKVIRYFITNNTLVDPIKQKLTYDLQIDKEKNQVTVGISFDSVNEVRKELYDKIMMTIQNVKVFPLDTNDKNMVVVNVMQKIGE